MSVSSSQEPSVHWGLLPQAHLLWRQMGQRWVVYDCGSGNTLATTPLEAAVLGMLDLSTLSFESMLHELRAVAGDVDGASLHKLLHSTLLRLSACDLIGTWTS